MWPHIVCEKEVEEEDVHGNDQLEKNALTPSTRSPRHKILNS